MKKTHNETTVGLFVIVGFILLALIVFFVSGVYLFRPGYSIYVLYDYVSILDKGAPVRMAGVRVGEVSKVDLAYEEKSQRVRVKVKLFIEKGVEIRENYQFKIQGTHILSEPHVEITPMAGSAPVLRNERVVEGVPLVPLENLLDRAHHIAENLEDILSGLHGALKTEETAKALKEMVINMASLTKSLDTVFHGSEDDLKQSIHNIRVSTDALQGVMEKIEKGEGTAGKLLTNDELYQEMKAFVTEIKTHPWKLMKKDGKKFLFF